MGLMLLAAAACPVHSQLPVQAPAQTADTADMLPLASPTLQPDWRSHIGWASRLDYFSSDYRLDDRKDFFGNTLQAKWEAGWRDALSLRADARATRPELASGSGYETVLNEAYASWRQGGTLLRVGQQIVAWGRADFLNPTDNLTPHDYVLLLPEDADQRAGRPSVLLKQALAGSYSLQVFATPFFKATQIPLPSALAVYVDQTPAASWKNTAVGLKLDRSGERVDGSISAYHGRNLTPNLAPLGFTAQAVPIAALRYVPIDVLGADIASTWGRYGLRAEAAYTRTGDDQGNDPLSRNSFWYAVLGADRSLGDSFNINLQWFGRHVQGFHDAAQLSDPLLRTAGEYNALIDQQQQRNSWGLSSRLAGTLYNDTLSADVLVVWNADRSNAYVRPALSYALSDHLGISLGAQLYAGDADSYFGNLRKNQGWFSEFRAAF